MTEHRSFWFKSFGLVCFAAAAMMIVPDLAAQRFEGGGGSGSTPVSEDDVREVDKQLKIPGVADLARRSVDDAVEAGQAQMIAQLDTEALKRARAAFDEQRYERAELLLDAFITHRAEQLAEAGDQQRDELQADLDRARLLLAHLLHRTERFEAAAETFAKISDDTPVDDFVHWLKGLALREAGKPTAAAQAFERAWKTKTTLVMPRARVEQAHALAAAKRWKQALPVLDEALSNFPDYPRRHRLLYQRAQALEALGQLDEAAEAYQKAWYDFPHKPEGVKARKQMRRLAKKGHAPEAFSREELFERYRRLRINKHWPLAEKLFLELKEREKTEDGHSAFEHEILMQLVLNDYVPQKNKEALAWLEQLRDAYESGHTAGISKELLYKYLSRTYSRLDKFDKALAALEKMTEGRGSYTKRSEKAEFYEDHGYYAKAKEIYDTYYSKWRKRGWHYTWLLYKTGDLEPAYENLTRLSERSRGRRRAKYMYWAARTLERGGNDEEALKLYDDVSNAYELGYYGLQARNRILDIRQRQAVDGNMLAQTRDLAEGGEVVLREMDAAANAIDESELPPPYRDPRLIPRTGEDTPAPPAVAAQVSHVKCEAETKEDQTFCELMAGRLTPQSKEVLRMALAPIEPYAGLLSTGLPPMTPEQAADASFDDDETTDDIVELGDTAGADAPAPRRGVKVSGRAKTPRVAYNTAARIYWEGRSDSPVAFVKAEKGQVIGPLPDRAWAYDDESYQGGLERAIAKAGDLFPQLERADWLREAGYQKFARWAMRDAALEFRGLSHRGRPRSTPHELPYGRWEYLIDNRRRESGLWGHNTDEKRFPVPSSASARRKLLERQQEIYDRRGDLKKLMLDAMKDVGDYHLVRRFTLGTGPWYRRSPQGPMRYKWMQAYPRAFPRLVMRHALKNGVNPYLLWALMTVESSYNPDSISPADAIGLLQVIPRTGMKTAEMLGDEDFGPFDLVDEDVAIEHGAFYFSKLVRKFEGQELLAIAGYNGGPHRVAAWMDKRGRNMPMDEFVEEIPFNEARGYVKKVLRFLSLYLRIYEGVDQLYVGQNMNLDYRFFPNF